MTNTELQNLIVANLLLGLKNQSQFFLDLLSSQELTLQEAKEIDKEISDINRVLNELSGKTVNYTIQELEALRNQFNDKLVQLNETISNLELNTLKIEFDSLTPEQKEFLKGATGEKGANGESSYQIALRYGFVGNELDYLASLKGADGEKGEDGQKGKNGESAYELALKNGFVGSESQYLQSLKGAEGEKGADGESIYQIALKNGFVGTELQYLASLNGESIYQIAVKNGFVGSESDYLASIGNSSSGENGAEYIKKSELYSILSKVTGMDLEELDSVINFLTDDQIFNIIVNLTLNDVIFSTDSEFKSGWTSYDNNISFEDNKLIYIQEYFDYLMKLQYRDPSGFGSFYPYTKSYILSSLDDYQQEINFISFDDFYTKFNDFKRGFNFSYPDSIIQNSNNTFLVFIHNDYFSLVIDSLKISNSISTDLDSNTIGEYFNSLDSDKQKQLANIIFNEINLNYDMKKHTLKIIVDSLHSMYLNGIRKFSLPETYLKFASNFFIKSNLAELKQLIRF